MFVTKEQSRKRSDQGADGKPMQAVGYDRGDGLGFYRLSAGQNESAGKIPANRAQPEAIDEGAEKVPAHRMQEGRMDAPPSGE